MMKEFSHAGLLALIRTTPSAVIVPVAIDGSWELMRYRMRPIPFGVRVRCTVLAPINQDDFPVKEIGKIAEQRIRASLEG